MSRNQRLTKEKEKISTQRDQLAEGKIMQVNKIKQIYSTYSSIQVNTEMQRKGAEKRWQSGTPLKAVTENAELNSHSR